MVRDQIFADLRGAILLRAQCTRVVAEVIHGQRQVGSERLAHGLAVIPRLRHRERLEVFLQPIRDLQQRVGAILHGGLAPCILCLVRGLDGLVHVYLLGTRHLAELLSADWRDIVQVLAILRRHPLTAYEVFIAVLEGHDGALRSGI